MRFLYPLFLVGALAVALPIVLHLLRREAAPEVLFTAVRLLRRSPPEQTRRRRLRDLLLLAARIAALLLLAGAFARPYFTSASQGAGLLIVALDRSYSMGAPGAFNRAVTLAREAIDAAVRGEQVAIIAFDDRAEVISPPSDLQDARAALRDLRPTAGSTRYAPVFARAAELSGQGRTRLVLIGDLQRTGWEQQEPVAIPRGIQIELRDAGSDAGNLAVTNVHRDTDTVVATIMNAGMKPAASTARLMLDGHYVASASFSAAASGSIDVQFPYRAPARGSLSVEIDDPGGYPADNSRYVVLDTTVRPRVLIVGADANQSGFYFSRAIQAAGGDEAFDVRTRPASALGALSSAELAAPSAIVLLSTRSLDRKARETLAGFVRGGGGLLVAASPDIDPSALTTIMGWSEFSVLEQATEPIMLAATDLRHPIFRAFGPLSANLGQIHFTRTWRIRADGWEIAARFTDGAAALLERREGKGRVVLFASDVDRRWNDFPLHPAFVPFALEAVRHITTRAGMRREYLVAEAPRGARAEPGVYSVEPNGRRVAVNVDARESATTRLTPAEFTAMVRPIESAPAASLELRAQQLEGQQNLWRYGLLFMTCALIAESFVARTR